jgi:hypothetical protein
VRISPVKSPLPYYVHRDAVWDHSILMPTPRFGNCHSSGYRSQTCWPLGEFGGGFGGGSGVSSLEYWTRSADHRYELRFGVLEVSILSFGSPCERVSDLKVGLAVAECWDPCWRRRVDRVVPRGKPRLFLAMLEAW